MPTHCTGRDWLSRQNSAFIKDIEEELEESGFYHIPYKQLIEAHLRRHTLTGVGATVRLT